MKKKEPSKLCIEVQLLNKTLNVNTEMFCDKAFNFYNLFVEEGPILIDIAEGVSYLYVKIK